MVNRSGVASIVVIAKLVRLGYLKPKKRYKPDVILKAIELLKADLWHAGVIEAGDLTEIAPPKLTKRRKLPSSRPSALN